MLAKATTSIPSLALLAIVTLASESLSALELALNKLTPRVPLPLMVVLVMAVVLSCSRIAPTPVLRLLTIALSVISRVPKAETMVLPLLPNELLFVITTRRKVALAPLAKNAPPPVALGASPSAIVMSVMVMIRWPLPTSTKTRDTPPPLIVS